MVTDRIKKELQKVATKERAKISSYFFKTGKGEYGEGDVFLGVTVPNVRPIVKMYLHEISLDACVLLLQSKYHEERLAACVAFVEMYTKFSKKNDEKMLATIYKTYLENTDRINNWDLVDISCKDVVGAFLFEKERKPLYVLVQSKKLWERRIAIVSTLYFIKKGNYKDTFSLCEILMEDKHDLIHKACGWMLREVGKSCGKETLTLFLEKNIRKMPRTMLRYSIEKYSPIERAKFLSR